MAVDFFSFTVVGIFVWIVVSVAGILYFIVSLLWYQEVHPVVGIVSVVSIIGAWFVMSKFVRWQN